MTLLFRRFKRGRLSITRLSNVDKRAAERYKNSVFFSTAASRILNYRDTPWTQKNTRVERMPSRIPRDPLVISVLIWLWSSIIWSINTGLNNYSRSLTRGQVSRSNTGVITQSKCWRRNFSFYIRRCNVALRDSRGIVIVHDFCTTIEFICCIWRITIKTLKESTQESEFLSNKGARKLGPLNPIK